MLFRSPLAQVLRALSTFEGVGRSLDPGFSLVAIAKPYLLPLMTSSGSGPSELFNDLSRQAAQVSTRALGLPKRLDEGLARLEQGDLQLQIRAGESDRLLRRLALSQQLSGQAVLLGALAIAAAVLAAGARPALALLPGLGALPVAWGWLRLSGRIARDLRLDRLS